MKVLVTGGAGYIGSHCVFALKEAQHDVVVLDDLSTGFEDAVPQDIPFYRGSVRDEALLATLFQNEKIDAIIHLAASTVLSESIAHPLHYYEQNTLGTVSLLKACLAYQVPYFIYSSTAAVYGKPLNDNIDETHPILTENPYGMSKWMSEQIIKDTAQSAPLKYLILRYFNVAGAHPYHPIGQRTRNATHLIKAAVETACGKRKQLAIYGQQYPTPDGTCIRDFIHVCDLANAHVLGLNHLQQGKDSTLLNCGYGHGHSILEVVRTLESLLGKKLPVSYEAAREGDVACVIANISKIQNVLPWVPKYDDLQIILQTALAWERTLPLES